MYSNTIGSSDIKQKAIYHYILKANRFEKKFLGFLMDDFYKPIFISYSIIKETFDYTCDKFKLRPDSDHFFKILIR